MDGTTPWVGIFLAVGENVAQQSLGAGGDAPGEVALPETRSKILISMKLASRELGVLSVESDRENAFGPEDRVLLEAVADKLARFLAGRGQVSCSQSSHRRVPDGNARSRPDVGASVPLVLVSP